MADPKERQQKLKKAGERIISKIREQQKAKGITASGASAESLRQEVTPFSLRIIGFSYLFQQVSGRRPGKFPHDKSGPPSWKKGGSIYEWITQKNISVRGLKQEQLAFLIARKVAKEGTDIHQGKREGLDLNAILLSIKDQFINPIADQQRREVASELFGKNTQ